MTWGGKFKEGEGRAQMRRAKADVLKVENDSNGSLQGHGRMETGGS